MAGYWNYDLGKYVYDKTCKVCQGVFTASRYHAKYCSVKCRVKASRERKKREYGR